MWKKTMAIGSLAVGLVGVAWASGDWSAAISKVNELKAKQGDLRKLTPEETRKIVTAICEADQDQRKKVGEEAVDRVARTVNGQLGELRSIRDQAYRLLDDVIADDRMQDKREEAKQMREDVSKRWDSTERMAENAMRGANNPLVSFLIQAGQQAHDDRESGCDAKEFTLDSGKRVDCLMANGETCLVVELKPNNTVGIRNGLDQVREYARELNKELTSSDSRVIERLKSSKSEFARCKTFEYRVDRYTLCPVIEEDGSFREPRVDWKKDCS